MVSEARGRLFKRKDGKYLIYLPLHLTEDSMFPFKGPDSILVKVSFNPGDNKLLIGKWEEPARLPPLREGIYKPPKPKPKPKRKNKKKSDS